MTITYIEDRHIDKKDLKMLYTDVGWYAYTQDIHQLEQALLNSLYVLSAWDEDRLVGLIRLVGDGLTIIYIQDILILNSYQNKGIATELMMQVFQEFNEVRQKVLLTEEAPAVRRFYERNGFQSCDKGTLVAFANMN
ncbi:GNAT family N-acetyltransferase [Planococcus sp. CPCC 101016]|uniref:GNAT family N-acetyltransferase n=1 Tax=Planococcus sp. CPCC 101016 TaxID=2599617 RepID=UPI0011B81886|nr:GNAT family N-acetyltransferase [Planococcus sp. CPCC 101016]TWT08014.1 GNAT family N-acetyltransferase [Planococcus sp. CPCC 101016]